MRLHRTAPFALLLLTAGCTGGIAQEELPNEIAVAYCDTITSCAGSFSSLSVSSRAACEQGFAELFRYSFEGDLGVLLERGTVGYDAGQAGACIDAIRDLGCDLTIAASPSACRDVFVGTLDPGEACAGDEECAGDAYCDGEDCPETRGVCASRKGNGASCDRDGECQSGLVCRDGSCGPNPSRRGGACDPSEGRTCPLDQVCIGQDGDTPGTCVTIADLQTAAMGEACELGGDDRIFCQEGLHCAVTGADGATPIQECLASSSDACFAAVPSMCPEEQYCDAQPRMGVFEGSCRPLPTQGQPCATVEDGPRCAAGLNCAFDLTTCVRRQGEGAPCTSNSECYSFDCQEDGTCAGPSACPPA